MDQNHQGSQFRQQSRLNDVDGGGSRQASHLRHELYQRSLVQPSYYKTDDEELNNYITDQQTMLTDRDLSMKLLVFEVVLLFLMIMVQSFIWQNHTIYTTWYSKTQGIWVTFLFLFEFFGIHTLFYLHFNRLECYFPTTIIVHVLMLANVLAFLFLQKKNYLKWVFYTEIGLILVISIVAGVRFFYMIRVRHFYKYKSTMTLVVAGSKDRK